MDVLALAVNEKIGTVIDEELLEELVSERKKLEINNLIDMKVFDIAERPNGKSH